MHNSAQPERGVDQSPAGGRVSTAAEPPLVLQNLRMTTGITPLLRDSGIPDTQPSDE